MLNRQNHSDNSFKSLELVSSMLLRFYEELILFKPTSIKSSYLDELDVVSVEGLVGNEEIVGG